MTQIPESMHFCRNYTIPTSAIGHTQSYDEPMVHSSTTMYGNVVKMRPEEHSTQLMFDTCYIHCTNCSCIRRMEKCHNLEVRTHVISTWSYALGKRIQTRQSSTRVCIFKICIALFLGYFGLGNPAYPCG